MTGVIFRQPAKGQFGLPGQVRIGLSQAIRINFDQGAAGRVQVFDRIFPKRGAQGGMTTVSLRTIALMSHRAAVS